MVDAAEVIGALFGAVGRRGGVDPVFFVTDSLLDEATDIGFQGRVRDETIKTH